MVSFKVPKGKTARVWIRTCVDVGDHGPHRIRDLLTLVNCPSPGLSLFALLLVSSFCLKSSGQVNAVGGLSKSPCFWNLTLTVIRQLLRAPAANPFKCRFYAKSRAPTASQLLRPYLAAEARVTYHTSLPSPRFFVSVGALSQGPCATVSQGSLPKPRVQKCACIPHFQNAVSPYLIVHVLFLKFLIFQLEPWIPLYNIQLISSVQP